MNYEEQIERDYMESIGYKNPLEFADRLEIELRLNEEAGESVRCILSDIKLDTHNHKGVLRKRTSACSCLLANLLASAWYGKPLCYSRDRNIYSQTPCTPSWFNYKIIIPILDELKKRSWMYQKKGIKGYYRNYLSRGFPTENLVEFFTDNNIRPLSIICEDISGRELRLKGYDGDNEIRYFENEEVRKWKDEIREYNNLVGSHNISLKIDLNTISETHRNRILKGISRGRIYHPILSYTQLTKLKTKPSSFDTFLSSNPLIFSAFKPLKSSLPSSVTQIESLFRLTHEHIYRVFNGSWNKGGRFAGPVYQNLSEEMRSQILIDGLPTVEKDFVATNISMFTNLSERPLTIDPYERLTSDPELREKYKTVANCVFFARHRGHAWYALRDDGFDWKFAQYLLDRFVAAFPELKSWFYKGRDLALEFQYLESEILRGIIQSLMKEDILPLVIHDSVIVQKQYADKLTGVMTEEWGRVLYKKTGRRFNPLIK